MKKRFAPSTAGFLIFFIVVVLVFVFESVEKQRFREALRSQAIGSLSKLRADIETNINANFYLTRGLIALVATHPDLTQDTFHRVSHNLLRHKNSIINIGLAPNNILSFVHPIKGNERAIGLDYEKNKKQWPAVEKAIEQRKTVVAGPVKLVQGGTAFISRTPIYIDTADNEQRRYWGLASIVIDKEKLFRSAGFYDPDREVRVAIRGADGLGSQGGLIDGSEEVFQQAPVLMDVLLPEGKWQLAAVPKQGWMQPSPNLFWIRSAGLLFAMLAGSGIFAWLRRLARTQAKIEQARERAEQASIALQKSENFLNAIIENLPLMIFVKEAKELRFVRFNQAGEELSGYSRDEILGKNVAELFSEQQANKYTEQDRAVLNGRTLLDIPEEIIETRHRGRRTVHVKKIPLLDIDQQPEYLLGISEDISEQLLATKEKQVLEKQLQQAHKMEAIGLMVGGVAHDLNNILAAITGYPELLLRKLPEDSDFRRPLQVVLDSGRRAVAIVADLLTVAKGAASMREVLNLNEQVEEYLDSPECLNTKTYFPNGVIRTQLAVDLHPILASSVHIKKCLMNLVNNAVEAMGGEGEIRLTTWNEAVVERTRSGYQLEAGDYVVLEVWDTGPGISVADIEHVFEPFYTKKMMGKGGTGLGLAVVWNTVKDHNGQVFVASNKHGTIFQLYFPVSQESISGLSEKLESETLPGKGEHILVIDDEPHLRDIACQMLKASGYRADAVDSGEAAIDFVAETPVDLLLIDMLMEPGINGGEAYARIIEKYPDQKALIASGFSESDDVKAALRLGTANFIHKPYSIDQLCVAVKELLKPIDEESGDSC